jgi:hypothetical protein
VKACSRPHCQPDFALQVKLFAQAFADKMPLYSLVRASTKAEVEEAKQKLVEGLKARVLHVCRDTQKPAVHVQVTHGRCNRSHSMTLSLMCSTWSTSCKSMRCLRIQGTSSAASTAMLRR